jgi:hypothetical protein
MINKRAKQIHERQNNITSCIFIGTMYVWINDSSIGNGDSHAASMVDKHTKPIGVDTKHERTRLWESEWERKEESRVISPLSPLSLFYRGGGRGVLFIFHGGVGIYNNATGATNGSRVCIYKDATKGYKWTSSIILRTPRLCNWDLNTIMGSSTYNAPSTKPNTLLQHT